MINRWDKFKINYKCDYKFMFGMRLLLQIHFVHKGKMVEYDKTKTRIKYNIQIKFLVGT